MKMIVQDSVIEALMQGMEMSRKEVKEFLTKVDTAVEVLSKTIKVDQYAKLGSYIAVERKEQAGRSGKSPKTGVAYTTETKEVINIKKTSAVKKTLA